MGWEKVFQGRGKAEDGWADRQAGPGRRVAPGCGWILTPIPDPDGSDTAIQRCATNFGGEALSRPIRAVAHYPGEGGREIPFS